MKLRNTWKKRNQLMLQHIIRSASAQLIGINKLQLQRWKKLFLVYCIDMYARATGCSTWNPHLPLWNHWCAWKFLLKHPVHFQAYSFPSELLLLHLKSERKIESNKKRWRNLTLNSLAAARHRMLWHLLCTLRLQRVCFTMATANCDTTNTV